MKRSSLVIACCAALWCLAGLFASKAWAIGTTPPSWTNFSNVASAYGSYHEGSDRILGYDHYGQPGVVMYDDTNYDLEYYRRLPGIGWGGIVLDWAGDVGNYPSLAFDRYERPAIVSYDWTNHRLNYTHFNGTDWIPEIVDADPAEYKGKYPHLAFDRLGRPAVAYWDETNYRLKFVQDKNGDFCLVNGNETPEIVNQYSSGSSCLWPSMEFDLLNRPIIAYTLYNSATGSFQLQCTIKDPTVGWQTWPLSNYNARYPSLAINPDTGLPAIAFYDAGNMDLTYWQATEAGGWNVTTIDSVGNTGLYPSLAFDPRDGNPAIAYYDSTNDDLRLAWNDGSSWHTQTVSTDGGRFPSLAFDQYGTGDPGIVWFGGGYLNYMEDPATVPEPSACILLLSGAAAFAVPLLRRSSARKNKKAFLGMHQSVISVNWHCWTSQQWHPAHFEE
jgi:hypothetical protein